MYTSLIQALCKDGRILRASKFFSDMRKDGFSPDAIAYTVMLRGHFQAKHMLDVMMLHADMIKTGILPNAVIYRIIAQGYQENGPLAISSRRGAASFSALALRSGQVVLPGLLDGGT
ncbi:hypothetical protein Patl1_18794 [Pistacia atlantica]|uniref:Uncharacterized protein n=1 Tax=Pistacia atlantica TaxID=434234 RepID=A0ACC1BYS9_9ROSI|nr:hypothetical protein Patl1_18794 [Pistacia atlantica]